MKVSFEGVGETLATFYNKATGGAEAGEPVCLSANAEIRACENGERFMGVAVGVSDAFAAVQTAGYTLMEYSGNTAPSVGYGRLIADGEGKVKPDSGTTGGEYLIVDVDETAKTVGFML